MGVSGLIDLVFSNPMWTSVTPESLGPANGHEYTYDVNFNTATSFTLTGDFDDASGGDPNSYFSRFGGPGSFSLNSTTGQFTYTITLAEAQAWSFPTAGFSIHNMLDEDFFTFNFTLCFAEGTGIATPEGERAIEDLRIGDMVTTADGRAVPVRWIGRTTINPMFNPADRLEPVLIRAGALGPSVPHADLIVTADHGMVLDGLVINAGAMVGLPGIEWYDWKRLGQGLSYYHVETKAHDVILANGAAAETYLDMADRRRFDNFGDYVALYGDTAPVAAEMPLPRISSQRLLPPALRARLGDGAADPAGLQDIA